MGSDTMVIKLSAQSSPPAPAAPVSEIPSLSSRNSEGMISEARLLEEEDNGRSAPFPGIIIKRRDWLVLVAGQGRGDGNAR